MELETLRKVYIYIICNEFLQNLHTIFSYVCIFDPIFLQSKRFSINSRSDPFKIETPSRRSYPFLKSFLCRRSRIAFNGVNGGGFVLESEERRSLPRINITSRRFFLRIFSIFRIIRFSHLRWGARGKSRGIRRPLDLRGGKIFKSPGACRERETIG